MRRFCLIFLISVLLQVPQPTSAGAWLREKGEGFISLSFASTVDLDTVSQTYIEYGYRDAMTIGADVGLIQQRIGVQGGFATLFATRALSGPDATSKWSYTLGFGANWANDLILPHIQTGMSWGRGIDLLQKDGWATVDANIFWDVISGIHVGKVDGTFGINLTDHIAGMMQVYFVRANGASTTTLAPSLILSPRDKTFRIQIGAEQAIGDVSGGVLKLGLWRTF